VERAEKTELVATLNAVFKSTGVIVVAHNKGLTVNQVNDLRGKMSSAGATIKVAKNRLAMLALDGTDANGIKASSWVLPVTSPSIPSAPGRAAFARARKFVVLGSALGRTVLDASGQGTRGTALARRAQEQIVRTGSATRIAGVAAPAARSPA
jgi:large subunit ribosomal protein L10